MARFFLGLVLCLFLASALVQAVRYKPCGGFSNKSCVPRHFCQFRDGSIPRNRGTSECPRTHACCPNANINEEAVPAQFEHRNPEATVSAETSTDTSPKIIFLPVTRINKSWTETNPSPDPLEQPQITYGVHNWSRNKRI
nr:uncharacterized protein LOC122321258 [Drosophila bipectinata]